MNEKALEGNIICLTCSSPMKLGPPSTPVSKGTWTFVMDFSINIIIGNQMSFSVELSSDRSITFRAPLKLWCHLEGLHAHGVQ